MAVQVPAQNEFSRRIKIVDLGDETTEEIEATGPERALLARRLGLIALDELSARVDLRRLPHDGSFRVSGTLSATVRQACVVTLEPVLSTVEHKFSQLFGAAPAGRPVAEELIDLDAEDPPEPIVDGAVDIGELVTEHLALALEPYPRREGARMKVGEWSGEETSRSPFAVLKSLKGSS
ncbi:MAG: DUF177 domain-containing protein [Kiloniellales bacterium]|nr:DUF177 domain-containing protein [Kiloniellales bacterium]